jgi:catecholate siderophore receptor
VTKRPGRWPGFLLLLAEASLFGTGVEPLPTANSVSRTCAFLPCLGAEQFYPLLLQMLCRNFIGRPRNADKKDRWVMARGIRAGLVQALVGIGTMAAPAMAAPAAGETVAAADSAAADAVESETIVVTGYAVSKLSDLRVPLATRDMPQTLTIVADQLLAEQGRRTLRDSLRNITGISFQAGEGNPPGGGDSFSIRGFAGRDDVFVDGIRDPGNYFRDPFNAERIEVTKGPASAFAGRGNIGGTVNIVSRQPVMENKGQAEIGVGTAAFGRVNLDANVVLDEAHGIALRFDAVAHTNDEPGRDYARSRRWGVAPSLGIGIGGPTRLVLSYFHLEQDDRPDMGLPNARNRSFAGSGLEGRPVPVNRRNYYGYTTDFRDVSTDIATLRFAHDVSDDLRLRNNTRYAHVAYAQSASSPRFVGNPTTITAATEAVGNRKFRDQVDTLFTNQTQLDWVARGDGLTNTLSVGVELIEERLNNRRTLDADGPRLNLFTPALLPAAPVAPNGTRVRIAVDTVSLYAFNTLEIGEQFSILAGLRWDSVKSRVQGFDDNGIAPGFVTDLSRRDREWSGNVGLVYKPAPNASLYVAYGTAFEPSARAEIVQPAGGNNNPPVTAANFQVPSERSRAFEAGAKLELMQGKLQLSGAVFEITKFNGRTPGVEPGDPPVVLQGRQRVRGLEAQVVGALTPEWNVYAGYTYLDGRVTRSNIPVQVGLRLDNAPEHSATLWTSYAITPKLILGGGVQHISSRRSDIPISLTAGNIVVTVPPFVTFDAFTEYKFSRRVAVRANAYNLADKRYFNAVNSAQSIPAPGRSGVLTLVLNY